MNRSCLQEPRLGPKLLGPGLRVQPLGTKECPFHFFLSLSVTHTFVLKFPLLSFP